MSGNGTATPREIIDEDYLDVTHWYKQQKEHKLRRVIRRILEGGYDQ